MMFRIVSALLIVGSGIVTLQARPLDGHQMLAIVLLVVAFLIMIVGMRREYKAIWLEQERRHQADTEWYERYDL